MLFVAGRWIATLRLQLAEISDTDAMQASYVHTCTPVWIIQPSIYCTMTVWCWKSNYRHTPTSSVGHVVALWSDETPPRVVIVQYRRNYKVTYGKLLLVLELGYLKTWKTYLYIISSQCQPKSFSSTRPLANTSIAMYLDTNTYYILIEQVHRNPNHIALDTNKTVNHFGDKKRTRRIENKSSRAAGREIVSVQRCKDWHDCITPIPYM